MDIVTLVFLAKLTKPKWIAGDENASDMLETVFFRKLSASALKKRILRGYYKENIHFKQNGGKIRLWSRDALLNEEITREGLTL